MTSAPTTADQPAPPRVANRVGPRAPASVRFYVCVLLLIVSAVGMHALARFFGWHFRKLPVELKKPLAALDWHKLAPRYKQHPIQPELLDEENVQALGTDMYVQARLVDTQRPALAPTAVARVFITYHTGQPDMVPHVPDECYLAGGYDAVGTPQAFRVSVSGVGAPHDQIPVRVVQFQARAGQDRPTVLYFFHTNGDYETTRLGVRLGLANPLERYAYYAKIEVTFTDNSADPRRRRSADVEESLEALAPLLTELMPVLLEEHFAWDRVDSGRYAASDE